MPSVSQFQNAVRARPAGTQILLQLKRGTETLDLKATLGSQPKEDEG